MYKHLSLFVAVLAAFALAACSDNDSLDDSAATSDTEVSTSYMAVNIYMTADAATRSSSTVSGGDNGNDYVTGEASEYAIDFDNSIFLFYDDNGTFLTYGTITTASGTASSTTSSTSDYAEWTSSAVVILGPTALTPTQVVGVFNDKNTAAYKDLDLDELQEKLFSKSNDITSSDDNAGILMSNAVSYNTTDGFAFATEISSDDIKDNSTDATNSPVDMYVERAKAKVEIDVNEDNFTEDKDESGNTTGTYTYTLKDEDGTNDRTFVYYYVDESGNLTSTDGAKVAITINGWAVNAYNTTGYVIKNYTYEDSEGNSTTLASGITSDSRGGAWGENWYSSLRIFWAVDGNYSYSDDDDEDSTDESSSDEEDTTWDLTYLSWTDVTTQTTPCSTDAAYYYEQTLDPNATTGYDEGQTAYAPTLLVAATVSVNTGSSGESTEETTEGKTRTTATSTNESSNSDLFLWWGSVLYSEDAMYAKILTLLKDAGYTGEETISKIEWEIAEADKGTVTIKSITMSNNTDVSNYISTINNSDFISSTTSSGTSYALRMYSAGACYYQVPIQTYISSTNGHPYGLVRNTAYSITINSVTGIGAGVPDTSEKLTEIPEEDETGYLACKINVLAWRVSTQSVDL